MSVFRQSAWLLLTLAAAQATALELESWRLEPRLTYGYGLAESRSMEASAELVAGVTTALTEGLWLEVSARGRFDGEEALDPGTVRDSRNARVVGNRQQAFGDEGSVELRDFYLERSLPGGLLRLGKQQLVWGKLDGLRVLDAVNPHNFREFILADFDESRIGLWSAYLDLTLGAWRAELAWLPDPTPHDVPAAGAWFELTARRFRFGAPGGSQEPAGITREPNWVSDGGGGLRLSRRFNRLQAALVAFSGPDFEALGRLRGDAENPVLERFHRRRTLYGASFEAPLGALVVRGELAAQPDRTFNTLTANGLSLADADHWMAGIGVDVEAPGDVFLNLQFLLDRVEDAPRGLVRPREDRIATLTLRRSFAYDTVTTEARWYGSFTDRDYLGRASVAWDVNDQVTLRLAGDLFGGDPDGVFGQFGDRDRVALSLELRF